MPRAYLRHEGTPEARTTVLLPEYIRDDDIQEVSEQSTFVRAGAEGPNCSVRATAAGLPSGTHANSPCSMAENKSAQTTFLLLTTRPWSGS